LLCGVEGIPQMRDERGQPVKL